LSGSELQSHRDAHWLGWAALAVFFSAWTALWQHLNQGPPSWDDSWYLTDSLALYDALAKWGVGGWLRCYLFEVQERLRAPLICALPTPIYLVFGRHSNLALAVNYLFIILLFWSVHGIARRFWGGRVALLAVFITGSLTESFVLTNWYLVEYGLAAIVVASIWCLIQSEDLTRTRWVALFSVFCGLGMLQKIVFPLYIGPLLVWCLARRVMRQGRSDSPSMAMTLAALVLPAAVIGGPWYLVNFRMVVGHAWLSGFSQEADLYGTGNPFTLGAVRKYPLLVINEGIGAAYFCVAVAATAVWIALRCYGRRRASPQGDGKGKFVLALWAAPFLVFLFGHNKQVRFIAPILPVFAMVLAIALSQIIETLGKWGWALTALLLLGAFAFLVQLCFEPLGVRNVVLWSDPSRPTDEMVGLHFLDPDMTVPPMYEANPWPLLKTLQDVIALRPRGPRKNYRVMTASDSIHFNLNNLSLAAAQARLPVQVCTTAYYDDPALLRSDIRAMDFVLFRQNTEIPDLHYNKLQADALDEVKGDGLFDAIPSAIRFPDHGVLWIYRNKSLAPAPPF